jgi:hypothetical protein
VELFVGVLVGLLLISVVVGRVLYRRYLERMMRNDVKLTDDTSSTRTDFNDIVPEPQEELVWVLPPPGTVPRRRVYEA